MTDWNSISSLYNGIADTRLTTVFQFVRSLVVNLRAGSLLDFGCGDGRFGLMCAKDFQRVVNFDLAPSMLDEARRNAEGVSNISTVNSICECPDHSFDVVTMNAVWMCLATFSECLSVLRSIARVLHRDGLFVASFTHPCFRDEQFSTYRTDFNMDKYLSNGARFRSTIFDGRSSVTVEDTHWNLDAVTSQLSATGFVVLRVFELPDAPATSHALPQPSSMACPWLVIVARIA
jgi:ubiquinone/menaquinone biosynthesis C-methylase UbiE